MKRKTGRAARNGSPRAVSRRASPRSATIAVHPLTSGRWPDLVRLFGANGACAGCWCMWPRLSAAGFRRGKGAGNRRALRRIVASGEPPGLLAYVNGEPAGWIALAPRAAYARLARSRVMAPPDDAPAWSVVCFFIAREHRRRGLARALLEGALKHAAARGATLVEGYPIDAKERVADTFAWFGLASVFRAAGFEEVARRSPTRPILRRRVRPSRNARALPSRSANG